MNQTAFSWIRVLTPVAAWLALSLPCEAGVMVDEEIRFFRAEGNPSGGGEYGVAYTSAPGHELFRTFSLNQQLSLDFNAHGFVIDGITTFARPGQEPLDSRVAYLYSHFRNGDLSHYDYLPNGMGHKESAESLQLAIWSLEGGSVTLNAESQAWIDEANAAISSGHWSGIGDVRILNLNWATSRQEHEGGDPAQDVLTIVPEPTSVMVWMVLGSLVTASLWLRRKPIVRSVANAGIPT